MAGEITTVKHNRIKATIQLTVLPFEPPEHVCAYDAAGEHHYIPLRALDVQTLERMLSDLRVQVLTRAGHGHVVTLLG